MSSSVECKGNNHSGKRNSIIAIELINIRALPRERNLQCIKMRKEPVLLKSDVRSGLAKMKTNKCDCNRVAVNLKRFGGTISLPKC